MKLRLPHPAAYALHKLIVFGRRKSKEKAEKDRLQAVHLLKYLDKYPLESKKIKQIFATMHPKWQKNLLASLEKLGEKELLALIKGQSPYSVAV